MTSPMKPGASISAPATSRSSPSISSLLGTRPSDAARGSCPSVARPWRLSSQAPMALSTTSRAMVSQPPMTAATWMITYSSTSGATMNSRTSHNMRRRLPADLVGCGCGCPVWRHGTAMSGVGSVSPQPHPNPKVPMQLLLLLVATGALIAGSASCAARLERESFSRRLLAARRARAGPDHRPGARGRLGPGIVPARLPAVRRRSRRGRARCSPSAASPAGRGPWRRGSPSGACGEGRGPTRSIALVVAVAAAFVAWQSLIALRVPVTSWDSLQYHLPEPSTWVLNGSVDRSGLTLTGSGYPQGQEVLHGWTMVFLHSIRGTGLVPLWLGMIAVLAVYRIARHLGVTGPSAVLGAAVFLSMPAAALQISTAYVDLGAAAFGLAALAFALEARRAEQPLALFAGATVAAAMAVATKPSAVPVVLAVAAVGAIVTRRLRREARDQGATGTPTVWTVWAAGAAVVVVLGGFWYLTNYATYRNPLYPVSILGFQGAGSFEQVVLNVQMPRSIAGDALPLQLWRSWTADLGHHAFVYDQRLGGLGAVWILLCVPSLAFMTWKLWSRDRLALGLLWAVGIATALVSPIGVVVPLLAAARRRRLRRPRPRRRRRPAAAGCRPHEEARRLHRVWAPALLAATLLLVGFTTVSAVSPSSEYALENTVPLQPMGTGELWSQMRHGDDADIRPWGAFAGPATSSPAAPRSPTSRRPRCRSPRWRWGPTSTTRWSPWTRRHRPAPWRSRCNARAPATSSSPTPSRPALWRPRPCATGCASGGITTSGLITGTSVWELGFFDECVGGRLVVTVADTGDSTVIAGRATDRCGALADAPIELWAAGAQADDPWKGAARVISGIETDDDGNFFTRTTNPNVTAERRYMVRFAGREDPTHYRPPSASKVIAVTS